MKKFLLVVAALVAVFYYCGTDRAKADKAAVVQAAKTYGSKAADSAGTALKNVAPKIK